MFGYALIFKVPVTSAADEILNFVLSCEKIWLDISCELSAKQTIHMKISSLIFLKKIKTILQGVICYNFWMGAISVKPIPASFG